MAYQQVVRYGTIALILAIVGVTTYVIATSNLSAQTTDTEVLNPQAVYEQLSQRASQFAEGDIHYETLELSIAEETYLQHREIVVDGLADPAILFENLTSCESAALLRHSSGQLQFREDMVRHTSQVIDQEGLAFQLGSAANHQEQVVLPPATTDLLMTPEVNQIVLDHATHILRPAEDVKAWSYVMEFDMSLGPWHQALGSTPPAGQVVEAGQDSDLVWLVYRGTSEDGGWPHAKYVFSTSKDMAPISVTLFSPDGILDERIFVYGELDDIDPIRPDLVLHVQPNEHDNTLSLVVRRINSWVHQVDNSASAFELPIQYMEVDERFGTPGSAYRVSSSKSEWIAALLQNLGSTRKDLDLNDDGIVDYADVLMLLDFDCDDPPCVQQPCISDP